MTQNTALEQKLQHVKQTLALAEKYDHAVNVLLSSITSPTS